MEYLNRKEIARAQQQAEEILALMDSVSRVAKRCWKGLTRYVAYVRLAQTGDFPELMARAHGVPVIGIKNLFHRL